MPKLNLLGWTISIFGKILKFDEVDNKPKGFQMKYSDWCILSNIEISTSTLFKWIIKKWATILLHAGVI